MARSCYKPLDYNDHLSNCEFGLTKEMVDCGQMRRCRFESVWRCGGRECPVFPTDHLDFAVAANNFDKLIPELGLQCRQTHHPVIGH
jgi:hypothetical protein